MREKIIYRKMEDADYQEVLEMVIETWDYREWIEKPLVKPMAEFFLCDLLVGADDVFVAVINSKIVGIVATSHEQWSRLQYVWQRRQLKSLLQLAGFEDKNYIFAQYMETMNIDEELLALSGKKYGGALNLLIVKEGYQGLGIGGKLYKHFYDYLQRLGVNNFYLFTDNSSNFKFYDHKGLQRVNQKNFFWKDEDGTPHKNPEIYYLYEGSITI
ncbi:GNAT family N-acetyltransferase [Lactobacillus sp. UCMA15818]|uniref:GNAT family N-acetyltransferase n=1 Tax=Lactobacillaceae TaxID=33958 RepID=UPI0025B085DA|nr:GNAT family N-acetyltransferase [Lactobacillus sp. UCMA15818]MDN2453930.1 GNAT family N-acetyltransferase [Lactobacillus sp. UCMA15818]